MGFMKTLVAIEVNVTATTAKTSLFQVSLAPDRTGSSLVNKHKGLDHVPQSHEFTATYQKNHNKLLPLLRRVTTLCLAPEAEKRLEQRYAFIRQHTALQCRLVI